MNGQDKSFAGPLRRQPVARRSLTGATSSRAYAPGETRPVNVIEELAQAGVTVELDRAGRAHFRSRAIAPPAARRAIEIHADLVETYLVEQAIVAFKREQESKP